VSRPSRFSTTETRCWRTRAVDALQSPRNASAASTTRWPKLVGQGDEIALGVDDGLLHPGGALLQQPAQQVRLARAGIALHQQARRQQLLRGRSIAVMPSGSSTMTAMATPTMPMGAPIAATPASSTGESFFASRITTASATRRRPKAIQASRAPGAAPWVGWSATKSARWRTSCT
jgi:hypothetical protein